MACKLPLIMKHVLILEALKWRQVRILEALIYGVSVRPWAELKPEVTITWSYLPLPRHRFESLWSCYVKKNTEVTVTNGSFVKLLHPGTRGPWYLPLLPFCCRIFAYARLLLNFQGLIKVLSLPLNFTAISRSPVNQYRTITITNHSTLRVGYSAKHGDPQKYEQSLWLGRGQGYKQLRGPEGTVPIGEWPRREEKAGRRYIPSTKAAVRSLYRKNES